MSASEFSRVIDIRQAGGKELRLEADAAECAALATRFGLVRIDRLEAQVALHREDRAVDVCGRLTGEIVQSCAVSAEDLPVAIEEELSFRFVPASEEHRPDEEVEIGAQDCDEIEYEGTAFDLGEAVAQSLGLAIDPYATGPNAEEARARAGISAPEESGPFAALKGLKGTD
jgi:uncharacterized metal-binding protein YceD (DUF177 family)